MNRIFLLMASVAVFAVVMAAGQAGAIHRGVGDLTCGACHTMHSSQGASSNNFGDITGSRILLRVSTTSATVHNLCLQCHASNGSQGATIQDNAATAPKVHLDGKSGAGNSTGAGVLDSFSVIGAGGDFSRVGSFNSATGLFGLFPQDATAAMGYGHSLGMTSVLPPGNSSTNTIGAAQITEITCTTCHDPHGTTLTSDSVNRFRNLKAGAAMWSDTGVMNPWSNMAAWGDLGASYVGGVQNTVLTVDAASSTSNIWPIYRATGPTQNSYRTLATAPFLAGSGGTGGAAMVALDGSAIYAGMSAWCAQCHGAWHEARTASNTNKGSGVNVFDWLRHPVDNVLVDSTGTAGNGMSIVDYGHYTWTYNNLALGTKLPVANATAGTPVYYGNEVGDKVFCLSCHFAHGGPYFDNLRWSYTSSVLAGNQTGVSIRSDTGCQQCHNRGGSWGQ